MPSEPRVMARMILTGFIGISWLGIGSYVFE
jgi:hypothetical protein